MEVYQLGEGKPEYAVIGSLHGDEPCGKKAIEKFLDSDYEFKKSVKFVVANEEALEQDTRFIDTDLNRSFPGDKHSDNHEERLAAQIIEEVKGLKVLDIHSTRSHPETFATVSSIDEVTQKLCSSAGVENAVYFPEENGALNEQVEGIVVEAGYQQSEKAVENAYDTIVNFLAAEGVIDAEFSLSDPEFYQYKETVEGDWIFTAENFRIVRQGEVYAEREDGEKLKAEEDFYPVLMSTEGYEGVLGFKAEKIDPSGI